MTRFLLSTFIACFIVTSFGCAMKSQQKPGADQSGQTTAQSAGDDAALRGQKGKIVEESIVSAPQSAVALDPLSPLGKPGLAGLRAIPFDYDQHLLSDDARNIISANAAILKSLAKVRFQLAGHCDERGSDQYNIALGERRAEAVRAYLDELGIVASRMETVSFGEEQPLDAGHDENAWQKNRRVEFLLLP